MCQLNIYMVPKTVPPEEVINLFEKSGLNVGLETYYKIEALTEDFNLYSTKGHCDCNSVISKLQDEGCNSFEEYKIKKKREDVEKLNKMKTLKSMEDYKARLIDYTTERDRLWEIVNNFKTYLQEFETGEYKRIKKLNIPESEKVKMIHKILCSKQEELEKNEDYQKAFKTYRDFSKKNSDLEESIYYDIDKYEEIVAGYSFDDFYSEYNNIKSAFTEIL
jgi:hypothetical protein